LIFTKKYLSLARLHGNRERTAMLVTSDHKKASKPQQASAIPTCLLEKLAEM